MPIVPCLRNTALKQNIHLCYNIAISNLDKYPMLAHISARGDITTCLQQHCLQEKRLELGQMTINGRINHGIHATDYGEVVKTSELKWYSTR